MIWDDNQSRCIGELSFRSEVRAVKLRRDRVVVVLERKIYIYNFSDLKLIDHIETYNNPKGIVALSHISTNNVLCCPGLQSGHLRIELYDHKKTTLIEAHESSLACIALNSTGNRVATASDTGTLIRIFDTLTGAPLQELRRGADRAEIYSIAWHPTSQWLATSSDKGTIHIFKCDHKVYDKQDDINNSDNNNNNTSIATTQQSNNTTNNTSSQSQSQSQSQSHNPVSSFSFMKKMLPKYFSSEWSFAQYRVNEQFTIVTFGSEYNSIIVLSGDGSYYKAYWDTQKPNTEAVQEFATTFLRNTT